MQIQFCASGKSATPENGQHIKLWSTQWQADRAPYRLGDDYLTAPKTTTAADKRAIWYAGGPALDQVNRLPSAMEFLRQTSTESIKNQALLKMCKVILPFVGVSDIS